MAKYGKVTIRGKTYYRTRFTMPDGSRRELYGKTQAELTAKVEEERKRTKNIRSDGNCPTVAEYAAIRLAIVKGQVQTATYADYEAKVRLYIAVPPLGNKKMLAVTADDVQQAMQLVTQYSSSTYRTVHMLMRGIFVAAKRSHVIAEDPTEGLSSRGGKGKKDLPALSDDQVSSLLAAVSGLPPETFVRIGLFSGLRREEILALQWDCVHLDIENPYIQVRRAWRIDHNRPVISTVLKTKAAKRDIPIPPALYNHLRAKKEVSQSDFVICNAGGQPLSGTQWRRLWAYITTRSTKERTYTRYTKDGTRGTHSVHPKLGEHAPHNPNVVYSMDFSVTPHQLRRTYITNLIYAGIDPKTVQYLAGHENSKITMDIYAKIKYNRPDDLAGVVNAAFINKDDSTDL